VYIDNNSALYVLDDGNYRIQSFLSNSTIGTTVLNSGYGTGLSQFASSKSSIIWMMSNIHVGGEIIIQDNLKFYFLLG
jgi:hypothetical protein